MRKQLALFCLILCTYPITFAKQETSNYKKDKSCVDTNGLSVTTSRSNKTSLAKTYVQKLMWKIGVVEKVVADTKAEAKKKGTYIPKPPFSTPIGELVFISLLVTALSPHLNKGYAAKQDRIIKDLQSTVEVLTKKIDSLMAK